MKGEKEIKCLDCEYAKIEDEITNFLLKLGFVEITTEGTINAQVIIKKGLFKNRYFMLK